MFDAGRPTIQAWLAAGALFVGIALAGSPPQPLLAQTSVIGQWRTLPYLMPINPIHIAVMNDGKVLVIAGSGNDATVTNYQAAVWDPVAGTIVTQPLAWDMFCNGMSVLPDGRVFINGGSLQYDPFFGEPRSAVFDPVTSTFTDVENMAHGRWYPTVTTLGDGRVMTFSGLKEAGGTNTTVEIYTVGSGWSPEYPAGWTPPLYPRMHLSTDGRVFYAGSGRGSRFFNPTTKAWTAVVATTNHGVTRSYGTSVLLPLRPAERLPAARDDFRRRQPGNRDDGNHRPVGGHAGLAVRAADVAAAHPDERDDPAERSGAGHGRIDEQRGREHQEPERRSLRSGHEHVQLGGSERVLAAVSLRLAAAAGRDGRCWSAETRTAAAYEEHIEIYSPAYLFNADGTDAARPTITGVTPGAFGYGQTFLVQTPDAANIASVVLVRPGAQTHAIDMEQRLVGLNFTAGDGVLNVTAPPNGNIAPPGYYMLFVLDAAGVPSVASFVRISGSISNQAPTAIVNSPATNVTVNPGGAVQFAGAEPTRTAPSAHMPGRSRAARRHRPRSPRRATSSTRRRAPTPHRSA